MFGQQGDKLYGIWKDHSMTKRTVLSVLVKY
mgnify:CR=1 FL=1